MPIPEVCDEQRFQTLLWFSFKSSLLFATRRHAMNSSTGRRTTPAARGYLQRSLWTSYEQVLACDTHPCMTLIPAGGLHAMWTLPQQSMKCISARGECATLLLRWQKWTPSTLMTCC